MSIINHVRRNLGGKIAAAAMAVALIAGAALPASAATTQTATGTGSASASVPITGTINPTTISVTVPNGVSYSINPDANTFTAPALSVTNNTVVPVTIGVQSLTADSSGTLTDVLPTAENWGSLNAADSSSKIALGISVTDSTGWSSGYNNSTDWAASHAPVTIGSLPSGATGNLALAANYGRAISTTQTPTGSVAFSVSLS
ncbi:hypothetical protein [Ethanoligenens sp.]|uniref:hypothetical protein n=1 Tax=Ethanoligenens sp. TaxID=2099655 RepID=UPI0039EB7087